MDPPEDLMQRVQDPEIIPLELSDLSFDGATFWEWSVRDGFLFALRRAVEVFESATTEARRRSRLLELLDGIQAVYVTGGRARKNELPTELGKTACRIVGETETVFAGERGGFHLLQARGEAGWVADLGKSQFKLMAPGRRWLFKRDWTRLPPAAEISPLEVTIQRRRLREFISFSLQIAMSESRRSPEGLVFALPTRLAEDGTPHGSSYAGMRGDRALLPDSMQLAGLGGRPLMVLNDAELAAFGARLDERLASYRKVLVLTLGLGIGAALIWRRAEDRAPGSVPSFSRPPSFV